MFVRFKTSVSTFFLHVFFPFFFSSPAFEPKYPPHVRILYVRTYVRTRVVISRAGTRVHHRLPSIADAVHDGEGKGAEKAHGR